MIIPFDMGRLFTGNSNPVENARVLKALMECLIAIDAAHLEFHPKTPRLTDPAFGVRYARTNEWLTIPQLAVYGIGDCKSLAAMRVAELRARGKAAQPVFRFRKNRTGGTDYHILVQTGVNAFQDPSKECGMGANEWAHFQR